ncbi:transposase [Streptomyces goshikiensis]|uniref:transposase n=1 Tax=Streptomyces goshikiensis TaxID=1942 RepID=UPI003687AC04
MSMQPKGLPQIPEQTMAVARAAFPKGSLVIRLAEVFADEPFAEGLTDRQAAAMPVRAIDWKYALGTELGDTGFDASVLSKFRSRLAGRGLERVVFDRLLEHCKGTGLVGAGGKQRTDSTHVIGAEPAGAGLGERAVRPGSPRSGGPGGWPSTSTSQSSPTAMGPA